MRRAKRRAPSEGESGGKRNVTTLAGRERDEGSGTVDVSRMRTWRVRLRSSWRSSMKVGEWVSDAAASMTSKQSLSLNDETSALVGDGTAETKRTHVIAGSQLV